MSEALGNLSTLANTNVTTESVNCSTPEVTCGWRVTFVGVYGDAEMLYADVDGLEGNAAAVSVVEETKGQIAAEVASSPATVRCTSRLEFLCAYCGEPRISDHYCIPTYPLKPTPTSCAETIATILR